MSTIDLEAECGLIARALEGLPLVEGVRASHFFFAGNRAAFIAVETLVSVGLVPSADRVAETLRGMRVNYIDSVDVLAYLAALIEQFAWGLDAEVYAERVVAAWRSREVVWVCERASALLRTGHNGPRVVDELSRRLREIEVAA